MRPPYTMERTVAPKNRSGMHTALQVLFCMVSVVCLALLGAHQVGL